MHELMLDYQDNRRRPGRGDVAVLVFSLVIVAVSVVMAISLLSRVSLLERQLSLLQRAATAVSSDSHNSTSDIRHLNSELKQASSIVELLSLPWDKLFADIEASLDTHVALLAVEPDPDKRALTITAEAKDFNSMLAYMKLLQKRASIKDVYLKSHHIVLNNAEHPVRFVLVASWVIQP